MLATGLLILKIIGLILLGILGLILALILTVLLVPVRYRAEASYLGEAKGKAEVSWLLHIISCKVAYDGELDMGIRIFGFRVGKKEEPDSQEAKETGRGPDARKTGRDPDAQKMEHGPDAGKTGRDPDVKKMEHGPDAGKTGRDPDAKKMEHGSGAEEMERNPELEEIRRGSESDQAQEDQKRLEAEILAELEEERREEERASREQDGGAAPEKKKKRRPRPKLPFSFQGICDKLKQAGEKKNQAVEFLKREENQRTFALVKRQLKALFRHILPRKMRGRVTFGFDDPYTTGRVLMYISPFYGLYGKRFQIIPVFEEPTLEGEVWLKGRIRIGTVLAIGIRMLFDRNFRTLLRTWRK